MARERIVSYDSISPEEEKFNITLRPEKLEDFIGQKSLVEKLSISIQAAKKRNEPLDHTLFHGPPGLGKTTLAHIIAHEMGSNLTTTSGPALERAGDLMGILSNLGDRDVLFIDEIHRLSKNLEEFLYPAIEDFKVDFVLDKGVHAKTVEVPLKPFTLVGATTRAGSLSSPLRNRFGIFHHLDFYPPVELQKIIMRSAEMLNIEIDSEGAMEISRRARGTPRIANRLLRRVRDFTQVREDGKINSEIARKALEMEGIDEMGLDSLDVKYLNTIMDFYKGGPVGIEAIAATLNEESDSLEDMVEPFLLKIGFLLRTKKGRKLSREALTHLKGDAKKLY